MMSGYVSMRGLVLFSACGALLGLPPASQALTILSDPLVITTTNAPLAGVVTFTTDVPARVSLRVNDGTMPWQRHFYDYTTTHRVLLLGCKAGRTNLITVTVHDLFRNEFTAPQPVIFITGPLPGDFPKCVLLKSIPDRMEPGYTLFRVQNNNNNKAYVAVVDHAGEVVWYSGVPTTSDVRQLENGNLFIPLTTNLTEINMMGERVNSWVVPTNRLVNLHDGVPTDHGTILYLSDASRVVPNFPTSSTNPNAPRKTTAVLYNRVIEISATNADLLNTWELIDLLQPTRINYLTFTIRTPLGWDCEHANAVIEDPRDDSLIVSMREQDAVIKFSRSTGRLKWILGPHENWGPEFQPYLLKPVGSPFQWQYAQHAPIITPQGTLLLYDNGNYRASPFNAFVTDNKNYSRAVEYAINEETKEISQVWEYGSNVPEPLYTDRVGNADWLPQTGHVLVNFGYVNYANHARPSPTAANAIMVRIQEVTHDPEPEVLFDLALFDYGNTNANYRGYFVYRSHRIQDLYAHPPRAVEDLAVTYDKKKPCLTFSADTTRTYVLERSTDLIQWETFGSPLLQESGYYKFQDDNFAIPSPCYYRVVTH